MLHFPTPIEVTVPAGRIYCHTKTKWQPRLTDGLRHPVRIIRLAKKVPSGR